MILFDEDRLSDSPFVERIWRCHSEGTAPFLSIAVSRSELVVTKVQGKITMTVRGPETKATPLGDSPADGEWFGIVLKLGTFLPHLPTSSGELDEIVVTPKPLEFRLGKNSDYNFVPQNFVRRCSQFLSR